VKQQGFEGSRGQGEPKGEKQELEKEPSEFNRGPLTSGLSGDLWRLSERHSRVS